MMRTDPIHSRTTMPTEALPSDFSILLVALAVVATCGLALTLIWGMEPSLTSTPAPAQAWPGKLAERASVNAALRSTDTRIHEIAESIAAGEAGALALGDPQVLHHHGLNTVANLGADDAARPDRFHHR
jgi:hypothetical protein